jgi:ankyrin repeat protein
MNHKDTETQSTPLLRPFSVPLCLCGSFLLAFASLASAASAPSPAPLADALQKRDLPAARALLADTAINAAQSDGMTALHWAVHHDDVDTTKLLLSSRADPNAQNRYGVTPLSLACTNGNAAIITLLLDAGADANTPLRGGETPLMTAARTGKLLAVQALLSHQADPNAKLPNGQTALMWAAAEGHTAVVSTLLTAGADLHASVDLGLNAFLFAARAGHTETVRALVQAGMDVNFASDPKTTPRNKQPKKGSTALTLAIENGRWELASLLLDLGADPNEFRNGYTPLHIISWIRKAAIGEDEGDPIPEENGSVTSEQVIRKLAAKGADLNARLTGGPSGGGRINPKGSTPFLLAADTADTAFLKILVELGADPTINTLDGVTPLMVAAGLGTRSVEEEAGTDDEAVEACTYLLSLGANIDAVSNLGDTAMHGAAFGNFPKTVKLLDAKGAKIEIWNQPDKKEWTPLLIAEGHRYGNFKPSFETIAAFHEVMRAHGLTPPPPTPPKPVLGYKTL